MKQNKNKLIKSNKQKLTGVVVAVSGLNTIAVSIEKKFMHSIYKKIITKSKKIHVHVDKPASQELIGKRVEVISCKPISKLKKWICV